MRNSLRLVAAALLAALLMAVPSGARAQEGLRLAPIPLPRDASVLKTTLRNWQDGDPIPFGFHTQRQPKIGLLIAGSLTFAIPYALSAKIAADGESKEMFVPVIGPFISAAKNESKGCSQYCSLHTLGTVVIAAEGIVQAAGLVMLVAGAVGKNVLAADEPGSVSVAPMVVPRGAGVGVSGQF